MLLVCEIVRRFGKDLIEKVFRVMSHPFIMTRALKIYAGAGIFLPWPLCSMTIAARFCAVSCSALTHADAKEEKNTLHHCHRLLVPFVFYLTEESHVAAGSDDAKDCTRLEKAMTAFRQLLTLDFIHRKLESRHIIIITILLTEQYILVCWKNGLLRFSRGCAS